MDQQQPLHAQLYAAMFQRIHSGAWRAGDRVPSERALIAEFGTSRGPVRQALAALRAGGMIGGGRGAPPRVQRPVPAQPFGNFVSFTDWAIGAGFTPGQRIIEAARRSANKDIALHLGVHPEDSVIEVVRLRTLNDAPALLERSAFPYDVGLSLLTADLSADGVHRHLAQRRIVPVCARHVIDAVAAHQLDAEWLRVPVGSPLLRARRVSRDAQGAVIEFADDRYLPTMTTFVIENTVKYRTPLVRESIGTHPRTKELS